MITIAYTCACGRKNKTPAGEPHTCQCGATVTLGDMAKGHVPNRAVDVTYVKKAALRYLGQGQDAPLLTDRQIADRRKDVQKGLAMFKVGKVGDLKVADLPKFMEFLGLT